VGVNVKNSVSICNQFKRPKNLSSRQFSRQEPIFHRFQQWGLAPAILGVFVSPFLKQQLNDLVAAFE
jgi:hypothetical protein